MVYEEGRGLVPYSENPDTGMAVPGSRQINQSIPSSADNPFPSGVVQDPAFQIPDSIAAEMLAEEDNLKPVAKNEEKIPGSTAPAHDNKQVARTPAPPTEEEI